MYLRSWILRYLGQVVQGCMQGCEQEGQRQSEVKLRDSQVGSTRCRHIQYSDCRYIHEIGTFIVWTECITCRRSKGTKTCVWVEHGRWVMYDTGVTIELGMGELETL